jgi:cell wall-associated NlpC family hydrolase
MRLANAARRFAGSPFRLHGRDPATGLDCIGVLAAALKDAGMPAPLPTGYSLRSRSIAGLETIAAQCGFGPATGAIEAGDVVLAQPNACQFHLLIALEQGSFVHAHAGIGRVILSAWPQDWRIVSHFRLAQPE